MLDEPLFVRFAPPIREQSPLRRAITAAYRRPEPECVAAMLEGAGLADPVRVAALETARRLVVALRAKRKGGGVEALIQEYALSSEEGVALMCLAEALLRIPDDDTRDALIRDKIAPGDWAAHLGDGHSLFVNAATWGLVVTGKLVGGVNGNGLGAALTRIVARAGEPVIRRSIDLAMRMMGEQFVIGQAIGEALKRGRSQETRGFFYSYDMLGEAAITATDAARYYADYERAVHAIGQAAAGRGVYRAPGISIKLSALHPRYSRAQADRVMAELMPRLKRLAVLAKGYDIGLNIDAEEADRLELSLDLLESLALDPDLNGWQGLGFVVQAYGKRCPQVIDWLIDLAARSQRRIMVRLVKGAYWDSEIKRAQVDGLADFPVYTRKLHTDVAYIACAKKLLQARNRIFPQFATHNAQTLATIYHMAGPDFAFGDYEFQCLHGMGEPLYEEVVGAGKLDRPCRIYAPVGSHETLLAYLVRRLLENGANSSFVHRVADPDVPIDALIADPVAAVASAASPGQPHEAIALPANLYRARRNSAGLDLSDECVLEGLREALRVGAERQPQVVSEYCDGQVREVRNPADHRDLVGHAVWASPEGVLAATARAVGSDWPSVPVDERSARLERAADIMQARMSALLGLIVREAGRSLPNAVAEVREAVDFLRYYAAQARDVLGNARSLGPVACISPWNFPLSIFTGQVAAALAAGNPVLAKPAEETPLIAAEAVRILHEAGVPAHALQLLPGDGDTGAALVAANEIAAVLFTGSTDAARAIQKQLSGRLSAEGKPIPLVAETGGLNAMVVDSSALPEQVVADVIASAFDSAGQRCSALRLLCLQEEVADRMLAMLRGALRELRSGRTDRLSTDIGPIITAEAKAAIEAHIEAMRAKGRPVEQLVLPPETAHGTFVPPTIIELEDISELTREVFGPVLHVVRYRRDRTHALIEAINATGYGLTFGLHTRLDETVGVVAPRIDAGNIYINRNMIGAVVGAQPFGGRNLSGTGPKAGGPLYLRRLVQVPPSFSASVRSDNLALRDFAAWLENRGESIAAAQARLYEACSPLGTELELPGPVGERNLYALYPRGRILLCPITFAGLYQQIASVLATGNDASVEGMNIPADLPSTVIARIKQDDKGPHSGALIEGDGDTLRAALVAIADRRGPLLLTQAASSAECAASEPAYFLCWLVEEQSVSINTTAAGGNASLMVLEQ